MGVLCEGLGGAPGDRGHLDPSAYSQDRSLSRLRSEGTFAQNAKAGRRYPKNPRTRHRTSTPKVETIHTGLGFLPSDPCRRGARVAWPGTAAGRSPREPTDYSAPTRNARRLIARPSSRRCRRRATDVGCRVPRGTRLRTALSTASVPVRTSPSPLPVLRAEG